MNTQISFVLIHLVSGLLLTLAHDDSEIFINSANRNQAPLIHLAKIKPNIFDYNNCPEVQQLCHHVDTNDVLSVLECVSSLQLNQLKSLTSTCQHSIWHYTKLVHTMKFVHDTLVRYSCEVQLETLASCEKAAHVLSCLFNKVEYSETGTCASIIRRIREVMFPDFDERREFFLACDSEINQFHCGRLNLEHKKISQLETIGCLQNKAKNDLSASCQNEIYNIQSQQKEIEFLDVCKHDILRLCSQERDDPSNAFKCLVSQKNEMLSSGCSENLMQRNNEIARDYRASHSLSRACKDDIKNHHCRRGVSDYKQVRLAQILLCLESLIKNGTQISLECRSEINDHRKMLMMDHNFSPEILSECSEDVSHFCSNVDEVLHCLMNLKVRREKRMSPRCQRALEHLLKVTDVGEDWRVDPVLRRACKSVVDIACSETAGGDARVMSCLMEHIDSHLMDRDCEQALLLIQYFVARDFKLDPQLYKHCRDDAVKYCHAKKFWEDGNNKQMDPERGPLIFPCLHRIAYSDDGKVSLHEQCLKEVKRVMRQRAISVDLIPEVEDVCIEDLSKYCKNKIERGAEMDCLQSNMEKLQLSCKDAVATYTEEEAGHVELNPIIMSVCMQAMKTYCEFIMKGGNGDMMDCLISHKNDAELRQDIKCRAAIEHFQIISLKNYRFTFKFKQACHSFVARFCTSSATKNEVVSCLSEVMVNDTIRGQRHSIPKECRQQIKAQLYQQRESLALDPKLANACRKEISQFCSTEKGPGQAVECLIQNTPHLGKSCHHAVFLIKETELADTDTDYTLVNTCKEMIYKYCPDKDSLHLLDCLKTHKDDPSFDPRCHLVVVNRMIEQNTDFRFNPSLQAACGKNIDQYCSNVIAMAKPNEELYGKVVECLKVKFRELRLYPQCEQEMIKTLQEQALNYKLNPLLKNFCKSEIEVLCKPHVNVEERGLIQECLKTAFLNQKIINRECKIEIATIIAESKADIHVDPILEEACTFDLLRYCSNVRSGNGRKLKCLQVVMQEQSKAMKEDCRNKLKRRMEMFANADNVLAQPPENMQQLMTQVITSPAKKFFIIILLTAVGMVFMMGIFLGRITKRALNTKNK